MVSWLLLDGLSACFAINLTKFGHWKHEIAGGGVSDSDSASARDLQAELYRLRKENHRLEIEHEILKKAVAFFVKKSGCGIK